MDSITRKYDIHDDKSSTKPQWLEISFSKGKSRVVNEEGRAINRTNIKINGVCARYLKGWNKKDFWPETSTEQHKKIEGDISCLTFSTYCLTFPDKNIKIKILWHAEKIIEEEYEIPSCCRVAGLIDFVKKDAPIVKNVPMDEPFYYMDRLLNHHMTLEEHGIVSGALIQVVPEALFGKDDDFSSFSQMATGSEYTNAYDFKKYATGMIEKIGIICQVKIEIKTIEVKNTNLKKTFYDHGTCGMIGDFLIITNSHVIENMTEEKKAIVKISYDRKDDPQAFEIDLDKDVVCESPEPKYLKFPTTKCLDYAILRLKPNANITKKQWETLKEFDAIGKKFFEKAQETWGKNKATNNKVLLPEKKGLNRANIIQHPLIKDPETKKLEPQPKLISFRGNQMKDLQFDPIVGHYSSFTSGGTSGAFVIDDDGNLLGLHYSSCIRVEEKLFRHRDALCIKLGYEKCKGCDQCEGKFCDHYTKKAIETKHLYVFLGVGIKGKCARDKKNKENIKLLKFIEEEQSGSLSSFIRDFFKDKNENAENKDDKIKNHILCNTAIQIDHIFNDLEKRFKQKLIDAREKSSHDWKEIRKSFFKKHQNYFIGGAGVALLVGVIGCIYKKELKSAWDNLHKLKTN